MVNRSNKHTSKLKIDGSPEPDVSPTLMLMRQNLLQQAHQYFKSNKYESLRVVSGKIYLRKNDSVLPTRITSEADLARLRKDDFLDASLLPFRGNFINQVKEILAHVRLTQSEVNNIQQLRDDLTSALDCVWPGIQIYLFGSVVTGLGIKTSDVDCYIQLPSRYEYSLHNPVKRAKIELNKNKAIFKQTFAITTAKVPILKFVHAPTGFSCDINFSSLSGVRNSKLIAFLLSLDRRALPLAIILKYWSKVFNLTGTNLMPNYAFTLMVIFYLQVNSVLPSVLEIQQHTRPQWVKCWNTAFNDNFPYTSDNTQSLYELLGGFFNFYRSFDYTQYVISPWLGRPVKKQQLIDIDHLRIYKLNILTGQCDIIRADTAVCIQDPFDHSRNCAVSVSPKLFNKMKGHIAIVLTAFNYSLRDDFLRQMFTHKLVYKPVETVEESESNFKNNYTYIHEVSHVYNTQLDSREMYGMTEARSQHRDRGTVRPTQGLQGLRGMQGRDIRFAKPYTNENVRSEPDGQFVCFVIFLCFVIWLHLNKYI